MHSDAIVPFVFETLPVRGAIVQLSQSWQRMLQSHEYDSPVREVLGHAAAATALIAHSVKADSAITLQISGDGPLSLLVMQCSSDLRFRGMASSQGETAGLVFHDLVAKARCAITIDSPAAERPYQGIVEVSGDSLAASLEDYYARSAQLPSRLRLLADERLCAGILLQQMPGARHPDADDWRRLGLLADTLTAKDVAGGIGTELVGKLFAEDNVRVFEARPAEFQCRCSRQRAEEVLRLLGSNECDAAVREQGVLVVTCEYCGRRQRFDRVDIAQLFAEAIVHGSDAVH